MVEITQAEKLLNEVVTLRWKCGDQAATIERLRAALQQSRSAVGMMYETLTYVREASECEQSRKAASETLAIADAALSQESAHDGY